MQTDAAKYMFTLYGGLILTNVLIAFWFWVKKRTAINSSLLRIWLGLFASLTMATLTQGSPFLLVVLGIAPGMYFGGIAASEILHRFNHEVPDFRTLHRVFFLTIALTAALYLAEAPFMIFALPAALISAAPLVIGLFKLAFGSKGGLSPAKLGFSLACAAMSLHMLDFPFFGARPDTAVWGFTVGTIIVFIFAIFGPMVIVELTTEEADLLRLERGRFESELKEAQAMLEVVADTASLLPLSLDARAIAVRTAQLAAEHARCCCAVHLLNHEGREHAIPAEVLYAFAGDGLGELRPRWLPDHEVTLKRLQVPVKRVIAEARRISGTSREGAFGSPAFDYMSIPLYDRGRPCGAMTLIAPMGSLGGRELRLLTELASRASSALQSAKLFEEAQRAIQLRDDFLSIASHELKTPLTPLNIQIETLRRLVDRGKLDSLPQHQLQRMLQLSAEQLRNLSKLLDGLLDVSRMAAGGVVLGAREPVDLAQIAGDVVSRFETQLQAAGCAVEIHAQPGVFGRWDKLRIDQIITNLVTNAMKYGPGKPITIEVGARDMRASVSVQDRGIGVASEDRERIFGRFERAVPVQRFGGLGLGLYIAREIARAHGGDIRVESQVGEWTRFVVMLPLEASALSMDSDARGEPLAAQSSKADAG